MPTESAPSLSLTQTTPEETVDGTLTEVFRKTADAKDIFNEKEKWYDLSYHGEP